mgnify:CR=1 FL=1
MRRIIIKKHLYIKNPDQQNKDINKLNLLWFYSNLLATTVIITIL